MYSNLTPWGKERLAMRETLKDDKQYYGAYGRKFLSNSNIESLIKDPASFNVPLEPTQAMLEGSYFHTAMLEPEKLKNFQIIDVASRATKAYKEACFEGERCLLRKEQLEVEKWVNKIKGDLEIHELIYNKNNKYELPEVDMIMDNLWKGKADIITDDYIIDLKTTNSKMHEFKYHASRFNYDSQAYLYQRLFNKKMLFIVIYKNTLQLQISPCSEAFIDNGRLKVENATKQYNKFYGNEKTHDPNHYIHREML